MTVAKIDPPENADEVYDVSFRPEQSLFQQSARRLFRNKAAVVGGIFILILVLMSVFAPVITSYDFAEQDLLANNAVPAWMLFLLPEGAENYANISDKFVLGADSLGRDTWTRTIYGARISLQFAFAAAAISLVVGTAYGAIAGYLGGWADDIMMRFVDFLYGFPFLIMVILMQSYFKALALRGSGGPFVQALIKANDNMGGLLFMFIAIGLINWLTLARVARGQVLSYKKKEFVEAAHSMGASDMRIILRHILPNIMGPLIVLETLAIPGYIFLEAFLSFIGLGVNPPTPSWGIMIAEATQSLRVYPNQILIPAIFLSVTTLAFNFLGDGLRDAFDPKMKN
ncbi:MAG: ABC transporter permease [Chloroflexi bacterium]|nr:ABC transporter permease [Chloroflexota bacterium]